MSSPSLSWPMPKLLALFASHRDMRVLSVKVKLCVTMMTSLSWFALRIPSAHLSAASRGAYSSTRIRKSRPLIVNAIEIFIAALIVSFVPARPCIARRTKELVEPGCSGGSCSRLGVGVVVVADGHEIRYLPVPQVNCRIRVLPLHRIGAVVHDIAQPQHQLDVLVLHVVGDPLCL